MQARECGGLDNAASVAIPQHRKGQQVAFQAMYVTYCFTALCFVGITCRILLTTSAEEPPQAMSEEPHWGPLPDVLMCAEDFQPEFLFSDTRLEADDQEEVQVYSRVSDGKQASSRDISKTLVQNPTGSGMCLSWRTSALFLTGEEWNDVQLRLSYRPGGRVGQWSLVLVGAESEGSTTDTAAMHIEAYKLGGPVGIVNSFTLHKSWTDWKHLIGHERVSTVTASWGTKMHFEHPSCPGTPLKDVSMSHSCDSDLEAVDLTLSLLQQHPRVTYVLGKDLLVFWLTVKVGAFLLVITFAYHAVFARTTPSKASEAAVEDTAAAKLEVGPDLVE